MWGTVPSLVGGVVGALLLLQTPSRVFAWLVPWLIAFATAALRAVRSDHRGGAAAGGPPAASGGVPRDPLAPGPLAYQFLVSVYGGYFGAGIGIMMLAGLALAGFTAIHPMIALRNYYAICINGVAALYFIARGAVDWPDAAVLTVGQIVGSWGGSRIVRNLPAGVIRAGGDRRGRGNGDIVTAEPLMEKELARWLDRSSKPAVPPLGDGRFDSFPSPPTPPSGTRVSI